MYSGYNFFSLFSFQNVALLCVLEYVTFSEMKSIVEVDVVYFLHLSSTNVKKRTSDLGVK